MEYSLIFQFESIYYPTLAAVGIIVNITAIVILKRGKCGLSKCITHYLLAMTSADLLLVIIDVILNRINNIYFPVNFLFITPVCGVKTVLFFSVLHCSVWFTVAFTFDRFVAICCSKLKAKYCTERTATIIVVTVSVISCLKSVPCYFVYVPLMIVDNVEWFCIQRPDYFTSSYWEVYEWTDSVITPMLPFFLILVFNSLTARNIIMANRIRKGLRGHDKTDTQIDPETENRRKSIVLLFALSSNFILLWITYLAHSLKWQVVNFNYTDKNLSDPVYVVQQVGFMLQLLSSCTNTCIYALTQKKFREELKNGIKYPFTLIVKLYGREH